MRKFVIATALVAALAATAGCGRSGGILAGRNAPDEFAVSRRAPLTIPPDFALVPPRPGAPRPQEADSSSQALQAMFGGPAQRTPGEAAVLSEAGSAPSPAIRTEATDPDTTIVNKGSSTRDILAAPEGDNPAATASTPQ